MLFAIIVFTLMVVCLVYTIFQNEYRKEQMTGKTSEALKLWRKVKEFVSLRWKAQKNDMKVLYVLLVIAILLVIVFCGIFGNNEDNFWRKDNPAKVEYVVPQEMLNLTED